MTGTPRDRGVNARALLELFARSSERREEVTVDDEGCWTGVGAEGSVTTVLKHTPDTC